MDQQNKKLITVLRDLCLQPGVSGSEAESGIVSLISAICRENGADSVSTDPEGNVVAVVGNGSRTVLLEAHLDEVGFEVAEIKAGGAISLLPCGVLKGDKVSGSAAFIVRTGAGGTVISDAEEGFSFLPSVPVLDVAIGDVVSFKRSFEQDGDTIVATALDNRIGCAVLLETVRACSEKRPEDVRTVFVFSPGEETDASSFTSVVGTYQPDLLFAVDAAYATPVDFEISEPLESIPVLGEGCAIQYKGKGFVIDPERIATLERIAHEQKIRVQRESVEGEKGRTNFSAFIKAGASAGAVINIPARDQHREKSTADIRDALEGVRLLRAIISDPAIVSELIRAVRLG